ncbi:MAG: hypothetical protein QM756_12365 [Polyangiaceae bacterium]
MHARKRSSKDNLCERGQIDSASLDNGIANSVGSHRAQLMDDFSVHGLRVVSELVERGTRPMLDSNNNALARAAGCDVATIQAWRSGATLPLDVAARIARAYRALFGTADSGVPIAAPTNAVAYRSPLEIR